MPGTPEEYMGSEDYSRATGILDELIDAGDVTSDKIMQALQSAGLRVYPEGMGEEEMLPEDIEAQMGEEPPMEEGMEGVPMDEDLAAMEEGPSMAGPAGGRDDLMDAVRFGMEEDKKKKSRHQEEMGGY